MPDRESAPPPNTREAFRLFGRLLLLIRSYWTALVKGIVLAVTLGLLTLLLPYFSKLLIDRVYPTHDVTLLEVLVCGYLLANLASTSLGALRGYYVQIVSSQLNTSAGLMFFNWILHAPMRFYDERRVGEILSRLGDMRGSLSTISQVMDTVIRQGIYLILIPPFLLLMNWKLALVSLMTLPITSTISLATAPVIRRLSKRAVEAGAALSAAQVEALAHIRTVKSVAGERRIFQDTRAAAELAQTRQFRASALGVVVGMVNGIVRVGGSTFMMWFGWSLIIRGEMTLGTFMAFSAYQGYVVGPLGQFTSLFMNIQQSAVSFGRVFEYLDQPAEQDPNDSLNVIPEPSRRLTGEIEMDHVSFAFGGGKEILHDLCLRIPAGSITTVLGASGVGKTTLLRLLCRLDDPTSGRILADGCSYTRIPLGELRRQVAVVWQDVGMLKRSLWENLTFGCESPSREEVDEVIRVCQLDGLIASLPDGYDTEIAEWGATLSGGQRQRIAVARVLLEGAPVLLLDEATSNLDVATEAELLRNVFGRLRGRTVVFATHRLHAARLADQVLYLERPGVASVGRHAELLVTCESYRLLHERVGEDIRPVRVLAGTREAT